MANRLQKKKFNIFSRVPILTLVTICLLIMIGVAVTSVETVNTAEKEKTIEELVMRSAIHCYAMEGAYPVDVAYLEENYNLNIDTENYTVYYELAASNKAPTIMVTYNDSQEGGL